MPFSSQAEGRVRSQTEVKVAHTSSGMACGESLRGQGLLQEETQALQVQAPPVPCTMLDTGEPQGARQACFMDGRAPCLCDSRVDGSHSQSQIQLIDYPECLQPKGWIFSSN